MGIAEVGRRMRERLRGEATGTEIVWQKDRQRLLIYTASLIVRSLEGWLLVNLEVETEQTKRQLLQFVFFIGKRGESDGMKAACTINPASAKGALLAEAWGRDLQRVLWDAVLDALESSLDQVSRTKESSMTLAGFHCDEKAIHVSVVAGEF